MLKNIVVVGTKQDLVFYGKSAARRQVKFQEVIDFCRENELSGCLEVSSRLDIEQIKEYQKSGRKAPLK